MMKFRAFPLASALLVLPCATQLACTTSGGGPNLTGGGTFTTGASDSTDGGSETATDTQTDTTQTSDSSSDSSTAEGDGDSDNSSTADDSNTSDGDSSGDGDDDDDASTSGDGDGETSACDGVTVVATGDPAAIDDFEDGNTDILPNDERSGDWSSWGDGSGTLSPDITAEAIADGVAGSTMALHFGGTGFTEWGAGAGPTFYAGGCYDFSAYTGISFWAKGTGLMRFAVATANTHEAYDCDALTEECSNHYGSGNLPLTTTWTQYTYLWADLAQPAWGPAKPFEPTKGVSLAFSHITDGGGGPDFDFWLDDVSFTSAP